MTENTTLAKIRAASRKLSEGQDLREEMELLVGPYANWEDFLVPTPYCICLLGELMIISTTTDFSLDKNPPKEGFKLIRYPKSFRACLMQVANSGWDAFNEANKNMDQIRLLSANVPSNLNVAVTILLNGTVEDIEDSLPIPMNAIKDTADECLALATCVEQKFVDVMSLTAELLEACVNAKGSYEQEAKETRIALEVAEANKKVAEEQKKMSEEAYRHLEKSVDNAEKACKDALNSMPSGWDMVGMMAVEGIANAATAAISGISTMMFHAKVPKQQSSSKQTNETGVAYQMTIDNDSVEAYSKISHVKGITDPLFLLCFPKNTLVTNLKEKEEAVMRILRQLSNMSAEIQSKVNNLEMDNLKDIITTGIDLSKDLLEAAGAMTVSEEESNALSKRALELKQKINIFEVQGKALLATNPSNISGTSLRSLPDPPEKQDSAVKQVVENARFKVEQASAQLENTRERYDKACDKLMENNEKLGKVMADIAKLNIENISFEKIRETLGKGIKALGELRQQWSKIVMFFQMMSNLIKCSLNKSLTSFLEHANTAEMRRLEGKSVSMVKRDMIYKQAFQGAKIAHVVNMIAGCYVEISNKHLMSRIAGLGKLLGFDPEKEMDEILKERRLLHQGLQEAQKSIKDLIIKKKKEFDRNSVERANKIKCELQAALPPTSESDKTDEQNQKAIKEGMQKIQTIQEDEANTMDADDLV